jgi:hypothetical protein
MIMIDIKIILVFKIDLEMEVFILIFTWMQLIKIYFSIKFYSFKES